MSAQVRCACSRCTIHGLMGPAIITTLGILFLLSELGRGYFSFGHTFPILFIVIGTILLASAVAPMDGHVSTPVVSGPPIAPAPPAAPPPGPYTGQRQ
jgi:hypothetical protein